MAKMDLPPEFVFEYKGKDYPPTYVKESTTASSEETEPDDAARSGEFSRSPSDQEKLKRKVTFANEPSLPDGEDSEDEADEDEQQRCMYTPTVTPHALIFPSPEKKGRYILFFACVLGWIIGI
jgi:hypothetical protein